MPAPAPDLACTDAVAVWAWLVADLHAAVASARHPLHVLTVATAGGAGGPDARAVVLRHVSADARVIRFHCDARSPKVAAITRDPRVSLHWYDLSRRMQVRIPATATIHHHDDVARGAWQTTQAMSRACYASPFPPGAALAAFPAAPSQPAADDDAGGANFAVVSCRFESVDLLSLHAAGHQRVLLQVDRDPVSWTVLAP
ncbi:MAG: pyridoxamine 5'-phosphate oxidase family protein [Planctomycetaceae bacterium]